MRLDTSYPRQGGDACSEDETMLNTEIEIEHLAMATMERHGAGAAKAAVARLNQMIDRGDRDGMERWACVVSLIHRSHGAGPAFASVERAAAARPV
jgi:hypothetical protein